MSEQANSLPAQPQYPTTNNRDEWLAHWLKCGQPWRTEPEIDSKRQKELAVVGLVIEVSLIASFTQRFFGK